MVQDQEKVWVSLPRLSQKELCLFRGETSSVTSANGLQSVDSRLGEKTLLFEGPKNLEAVIGFAEEQYVASLWSVITLNN